MYIYRELIIPDSIQTKKCIGNVQCHYRSVNLRI